MYNPFDNAEMTAVVRAYSASIIRLAFSYTRNHADAEDIAQEVFVAYLDKRPRCPDEAHRKAWLMRVTINRCRNLLKSGWKKRTCPMPEDGVGDRFVLSPQDRCIWQAVWELPEKYRLPIVLFYMEDLSLRHIASELHVPVSTVATWLDRGRQLLEQSLGDDFDG